MALLSMSWVALQKLARQRGLAANELDISICKVLHLLGS